jgi:hypothetical protein
MKKYLTGLVFLILLLPVCTGQVEPDSLLRKCMRATGPTSKYLKDFKVQLGEGISGSDFRYRANLSLWKNTRYRFTMCTSEDSKGRLILNIKDDLNRSILSSYDRKTETVYPYVEFVCNKSGIYRLFYDFTGNASGLGISIVSLVR